ncbi:MAG: EAL domain-containing protein [Nitrosomonadales bacterium]|nr:EAL domain-containing protein [Nitrosomonadales bacterium]
MNLPLHYSGKDLLRLVATALLYFLGAKIGLIFSLVGSSVTLFWMPAGIALAALLLYGYGMWPGVLLGAILGNLATGLSAAFEIALGSTLEAVAGAWLLRRFVFNLTMPENRDIFLLLATALLTALLSALLGVFWLGYNGLMPWDAYLPAMAYWWMGDTLGILLFTSLILAWAQHKPMQWTAPLVREAILHALLLVFFCALVFSDLSIALFDTSIGPFILLPLIVWSALRFNMRHALLSTSFVFLLSILGMVLEIGVFAPVTLESIRELWIFNLAMGVTALFMAVSSYQLRRSNYLLAQNEASLNRAQSVAGMGSWCLEIPDDYLKWSAETYRIFGKEPGTPLTFQDFLDCIHADDLGRVGAAWAAALQGADYDIEHRIVVDGQIKWVRESAQIDFAPGGGALRGIGVVSDITAQKRAEEERNRSQQMLQSVLDAVPVRIFWKDRDSRFIGANDLLLNDMGLESVAQLIGKSDVDFYPEYAATFRAEDLQVMTSGQSIINHEAMFREVDGSYRCQLVSKVPLRDDSEEIIGVLVTYTDVTERKRAEESLRLAAKVFESSGEAIVITDAKANIVAVNDTFTQLTGYRADEVLGRNPRLLSSGIHDAEFYRAMWESITQQGYWRGEIEDKDKSGRVYPKWMSINAVKNEQGEVTHYISIASDITERKEAEHNIQMLAFHDVLTGLPNRTLMRDRLEQMIAAAHRDSGQLSLLFLDLDRFKYVNDSMGHTVGDKLLQSVARRLLECVREGDTVARIGGDEFIVLLREANKDGAARVASKIIQVLAEPFEIETVQIVTHTSIGVCVYPDNASDSDTLIKNADVAMYRAKDEGRNNFQFFAEEMNFRATHIFLMEKDLRGALEQKQFLLHYQPQVDLASGLVCGAEALIRWRHPEKGFISPAEFIPVAEETGQIVAIGEWVLRTACAQLAEWRRLGLPVFPVAVNLSIRQLLQPALVNLVSEVLAETGLAPGDLELEITEGIMMGDTKSALAFLAKMHEMGVQLSIDDFGTGFSSLNYLKNLPVDKLKIDQSFVRDIETDTSDAAIVRSIISLGHRLELQVIAEGVETLEELDFLRIRGCDQIQGYYFSRPLPADEFERFLSSNPKLG